MDWNMWLSYLPLFREAAWLTVRLGLLGVLFSLLVGLFCAAVQYWNLPILRPLISAYVQVSRNTPLLIQLFFLYYALPKVGIPTSPAVCGVAGLSFLGGGYVAESFRSGLEAVERVQVESALSLGMTDAQSMAYVILPQAISTSVPALMANVVFLMKETSVFSAVSLMDLMFTAKDLIGLYYTTTESLSLLVLFYLLILLPISVLGTVLERRVRNAGFGT